jgi:hypothetical protein
MDAVVNTRLVMVLLRVVALEPGGRRDDNDDSSL